MSALEVISGARRWAVVHADCVEALAGLGERVVDHVVTDPPYSPHVHGKQRRMLRGAGGRAARDGGRRGEVGPASLGFDAIAPAVRAEAGRAFGLLARRWVLVFCDAESAGDWREALERGGLEHIRVGAWVKVAGQPQLSGDRPAVGFEAVEIAHRRGRKRWNGGGLPGVWHHQVATDRNNTGDRVHTTQKPLSLMLELVAQFTEPGDLVLDPFCGSGTTGVACLRLGRRFLGVERDPHYAQVARERLEAEAQGLSLRASRAGQISLFGGAR